MKIFDNISQHIQISELEKEHILSFFEMAEFPTKKVLLKSGDYAKETYFVNSGILRSYTLDKNYNEHTLSFACENWWISDLYSLFSGNPSHTFIEVLQSVEVLIISQENTEKMFVEIPKMERYFRILTQNALVANQQRIINKMTLTAEQRYEKFLQKFGKLAYNIPQKHIASYIGVTPEFFSKMKANMLKSK